jgi:hypothetical protein
MKLISTQQLESLLQVIYQTNISAQTYDAIKKMFTELKDEENKEINTGDTKGATKNTK